MRNSRHMVCNCRAARECPWRDREEGDAAVAIRQEGTS